MSPNRKSCGIAHYSAPRRRIPIHDEPTSRRRLAYLIVFLPGELTVLRLRSDVIELPSGSIINDYYVRETRGFVVIFALTPDDRVILVRQYKHGAGQVVLELPAGAIDAGESALVCAQRELAEETGYVGDEPELIGSYLADPTNSDGWFHLYAIRNAEARVAQAFDPTEDISVEFATPRELRTMVRDGRINTGSHVAAIYAALEFTGALPA